MMNRRPNVDGIIVGPTQEVADKCFAQAAAMIAADPYLSRRFKVKEHIKTIIDLHVDPVTGVQMNAKLKIKSFDPKVVTGSIPAFAILDELHVMAHAKYASHVIGQIRGGMVTNEESLLIIITTQSEVEPFGVFKEELDYARGVRDGRITEGVRMLPILYEFPEAMQIAEDKPWKNPKNWPAVLPNLGRSITIDRLTAEWRTAQDKGDGAAREWASQHLNIQIGQALHHGRWIGVDFWPAAADRRITLDYLIAHSDVITFGGDVGGLKDLWGLAALGRHKVTRHWMLWVPQILGENHAMVGFATVQDMVRAFLDDEETHLEAMVAFIREAKIDDDLRRIAALKRPSTAEDWREVARAYNGPKYAKHGYHTRLAKAHVKWRGIADTPWSAPLPPARPAEATAPAPAPVSSMTDYEVRALQQQLKDALYDPGFIDGKMGTRTRAALFAFQTDNGLPATGEMNAETRAFILAHGVPTRQLAPERERATAASLAEAGRLPPAAQAALKGGWWAKLQAVLGAIAMAIYGAWERSGDALSSLSPFKEDLLAAGPWLFFAAVIGISLVLWLRSRNALDQTVRAVRLGRDTGA
jgi:hypothetical protein